MNTLAFVGLLALLLTAWGLRKAAPTLKAMVVAWIAESDARRKEALASIPPQARPEPLYSLPARWIVLEISCTNCSAESFFRWVEVSDAGDIILVAECTSCSRPLMKAFTGDFIAEGLEEAQPDPSEPDPPPGPGVLPPLAPEKGDEKKKVN